MYERTYHTKVLKHDDKASSRKEIPWKRIGIVVAIVVGLAGIVFLIRVPQFQIRDVVVEGTRVADPVEVSDYVLGELSGYYLWVLPKTSIFLSGPEHMSARIRAQFPRFNSIKITRDSMHSLKLVVTEYPGVYLWCDTAQTCSFMDETGTVFADAPYFSGSAYLKIYSGERAVYPFRPLTDGQLPMIVQIEQKLQSIDIAPLEFHADDEHTLSIHFYHNGDTAMILFDPQRDIGEALDVLYSGLRTDPLQKLYHDRSKVLQYLDLRFANKVVYKFN